MRLRDVEFWEEEIINHKFDDEDEDNEDDELNDKGYDEA